MNAPWLLKQVEDAFDTYTSRTPKTATATVSQLVDPTGSRNVLELTEMPWDDGTDYPYSVLEFDDYHAVVLRSADLTAKTLTWRRPLKASISVGSTVTLSTTPLAGAHVLLGGGPSHSRRRIVIAETGFREGPMAIGQTAPPEFRLETISFLVQVMVLFPDAHQPGTARARYCDYLYMREQTVEVIREGLGLDCSPRRVVRGDMSSYPTSGKPPEHVYAVDLQVDAEIQA